MSTQDAGPGALLPTVFSAYQPIEDYLEQLSQAGVAAGAAAELRPIDAALFHFLAALCPSPPTVVDLAGAATGGASAVLCGAQARAGRVIVVHRGLGRVAGEPWRPVAQRVLDGLRPSLPIEEAAGGWAPSAEAGQGRGLTMALLAEEDPQELTAQTAQLLRGGRDVLVLVLGLGATGQCPRVEALTAAFGCRSPHRLTLLRERAAAFHESRLAAVYPRGCRAVAALLERLQRQFDGNFSLLALARTACDAALRAADLDESILEAHPFGKLAGTRRRIAELEHSVGEWEKYHRQTVENWQRVYGELEAKVIAGGAAMKVVLGLKKMRRALAPERTARHWLLRKLLGAARVLKRQGLRGVLRRLFRKGAPDGAAAK